MKIWLLFCLLGIALAGSYEDESNDGNGLNFGGMNNFGTGAIYPFDAFNLGYDKLFSRIHPPLIAAMNKFVPTLESAELQSESSSQTYEEQSVSSKSEKVLLKSSSHSSASDSSSESKQSTSESKNASKSSLKSVSIEEHRKSLSDSSMSSISGEKEQSASSQFRKVSVEISSSNSESSSKTIHSKFEPEIASDAEETASRVSSSAISSVEPERPHTSEEKSETQGVSSSNRKRDEMSEASQLSSAENQSKSESKFKSISSEQDLGKSKGESSDIDSDATIFVLKSVEKSESEVDRVSMSNSEAEDVKSSAVSSDGVELNSAEESNKKESDSETDVRSVFENVSSSSEKIGSFATTIKMDSAEAGLSFNPAYVNDEMTCDTVESVPDSWIESEIQHSHKNKDMAHKLSLQDIRKALEDGYKDLALMKKRLYKKQIIIDDLNQVIYDLQALCDKICQEVPVKYLMP